MDDAGPSLPTEGGPGRSAPQGSVGAFGDHAETPAPFGGCKPSPYGVAEIAVTTSGSEAWRHRRAFEFSLAIRHSSYFCADPWYARRRLTPERQLYSLAGSDAVVTWENTNIGDAFAGAAQEGSRMKRSIIFAVLFGFILGAALVMRRRAEK